MPIVCNYNEHVSIIFLNYRERVFIVFNYENTFIIYEITIIRARARNFLFYNVSTIC